MSDEIIVLSSMATGRALSDLADMYRRQTRREVAVKSMGGVDAARLVRTGEPADVVILASRAMERLEMEGKLVEGSLAGFARSRIAVAIPSGAAQPIINDAASAKRAMLAARRICYSTGPSGDHILDLWKRWGLSESLAPRAVLAPPGVSVASILARGQADLGFQQLSELLDQPGIEIVGPLPDEIQSITLFSAAISRSSSRVEEARGLIEYLNCRDAVALKHRCGLEPA